eukprot:scaffold21607_cov17-Tisochrysis_lutea.AAC.1
MMRQARQRIANEIRAKVVLSPLCGPLLAGVVVLDDVPRTAVDRQQDQDQKGAWAAARSAAAAKKRMNQ